MENGVNSHFKDNREQHESELQEDQGATGRGKPCGLTHGALPPAETPTTQIGLPV